MRRVLGAVLVAALGLGGCGFLPSAAPPLEQTGWRAVVVAGRQPIVGREPTLRFAGGTVTGSGGCNRIDGGYRIDGDRIETLELGITLMGCPAPIGEIEGALIEALAKAETMRFDGQNLVIAGPGGEVVLRPDSTVR